MCTDVIAITCAHTMFLLRRISKGSVVVSYQLVLKREYALADLMNIMRGFIEWQDGKMGSFEVNADSIMFSGKLTWNLYVISINMRFL